MSDLASFELESSLTIQNQDSIGEWRVSCQQEQDFAYFPLWGPYEIHLIAEG